MRKEFDKNSINGNKFLNTKMKFFSRKITTDFHVNKEKEKTPKIGSYCFYLQEIAPDSMYRMKTDDDY